MKTKYIYWAIGALLVLFFLGKRKGNAKQLSSASGRTGSTQTAGTPTSFWAGWMTQTDQSLKATTATVKSASDAITSLTKGITGLFGGSSSATGEKTAQTSGGGAGVPITYASDNSDNGFFDRFF